MINKMTSVLFIIFDLLKLYICAVLNVREQFLCAVLNVREKIFIYIYM